MKHFFSLLDRGREEADAEIAVAYQEISDSEDDGDALPEAEGQEVVPDGNEAAHNIEEGDNGYM